MFFTVYEFCVVISVTGSLHEVRFPRNAFQVRMAGTGDFLYVASTVALHVKLLFQYHVVAHLNVVYLISFAGSNICSVSHIVCFVNINPSRESVGKANVISESN